MMNENDAYINWIFVSPQVVKLTMTDNTVRSYPMQKILEYANQKPSSLKDLEEFQGLIDKDHWFSKTGREPTLRILSEEYLRTMGTDLDCPVTVLEGKFMYEGSQTFSFGMVLIDGTHRLLKSLIKGRKTVSTVVVTARELLLHVTEIS